jgi:hypothetical protein
VSDDALARQKAEQNMARLSTATRAFISRTRNEAHVIMRELVDPDGETVASLVDGEATAGAMALLLPMDLITWETWMLGQIGDRDELDLDVNTHHDLWFQFGSWIGETLKDRHGGFWLLHTDDPHNWRVGFTKILLEIAPHQFAEKLLRSGEGFGRRMISEIERIRQGHETQAESEGGKAKDKYGPQHYARLHNVPLAQWMVLDLARVHSLWREKPAGELREAVQKDGKRLPAQNAPILAKLDEAFAQLDAAKPAGDQQVDRNVFEAVAQIVGLRRATQPVAVDMMEKIVLPTIHLGVPSQFPPLGGDDIETIKKGTDLYAVFVDVVPYAHQAEEGGFLGTFAQKDMSTPYPDRLNLEVGKGDWVAINPASLKPLLDKFEPQRLLGKFDEFVAYVRKQEGVPRLADTGRKLAEGVMRAVLELKACVQGMQAGHALVFRLLPPPG